LQFDDNVAIVISQEGNPKGTHVFGPVARELQKSDFSKIVLLAPEAL
jgi:large subunit ribosomal protein L14